MYENPELGFKMQYPSNWAKAGNDKGIIPVMFTLTEANDPPTAASQQQLSGSPTNNKIKANLLVNVQPVGSSSSLQQTRQEGNAEAQQQTKASLEQFSLKQINELMKSKNTKFNILESNSSATYLESRIPQHTNLFIMEQRLQIMQK